MLVLAFLFSLAAALALHVASPTQQLIARRLRAGRRYAGLLTLVALLCAMQALGAAFGLVTALALGAASLFIVSLLAAERRRALSSNNT